MSTFLELCQKTCRESGTVQGTQPSSVSGQSGRLLKFVNWTADAWTQIQNLHAAWRWMRAELDSSNCVTTSGSARYTAASWSINDFAEWIDEPESLSIYLQSLGVSDEGQIKVVTWDYWRKRYARGTQDTNRPSEVAISPANELCLGPTPNGIYVVNGEYRTTAQILTANDDVPNCPARFHDIISWYAVLLAGEHDEASLQGIARANRNYGAFLSALERDQLPQITIGGGPIA